MTEFYMIIARKIFFPIFYWGWGNLPPSPTLLEGGINLPHGRLKTLAALLTLSVLFATQAVIQEKQIKKKRQT